MRDLHKIPQVTLRELAFMCSSAGSQRPGISAHTPMQTLRPITPQRATTLACRAPPLSPSCLVPERGGNKCRLEATSPGLKPQLGHLL